LGRCENQAGAPLFIKGQRLRVCKLRVSSMKKLVLTLLVIPLIIVMAVQDPQGAGHLVQVVITDGAKLLDVVARFLHDLFTHH
jgi:hypothetical protein